MRTAEAADRAAARLTSVVAQLDGPPGPVHPIVPRENRDETIVSGLASNPYGLLPADIHPTTGALWGNFAQTYSMAGIINSASRLSVKWEDVWCRASS